MPLLDRDRSEGLSAVAPVVAVLLAVHRLEQVLLGRNLLEVTLLVDEPLLVLLLAVHVWLRPLDLRHLRVVL